MALMGTGKIRPYQDILTGKVWLFPDNVDTDVISPGKYLENLQATLDHTCETIVKEFPTEVQPGDIIVAGRNFGCGSSRETAPKVLQAKEVGAVIAESFARIFYRSSFACGLPIMEVPGISKEFEKGDQIEINLINAEVKNLRTGKVLKGNPIPDLLLNLLKNGGMEKQLLAELKELGRKQKKAE